MAPGTGSNKIMTTGQLCCAAASLCVAFKSAQAKLAALPVIMPIVGPRETHDYRELHLPGVYI